MKLILILHAGLNGDRLHQIADTLGLLAHTDLGAVHGAGSSGRREGSRAFPGNSQAMFAVVEDADVKRLMDSLSLTRDQLPTGESLRAFVLPVDQML